MLTTKEVDAIRRRLKAAEKRDNEQRASTAKAAKYHNASNKKIAKMRSKAGN